MNRTQIITTTLITLLLATVGTGMANFTSLQAQEPVLDAFNMSISPPIAYLQSKPGQTLTHSITLENNSVTTQTFKPKLVDFVPNSTDGSPYLQPTTTFPYLSPPTTNLFNQTIILKAGEQRTLPITFIIPPDAANKEFHLTLLFTSQSNPEFNIGGAGGEVLGSIGSNIVLLVSDGVSGGQLRFSQIRAPQYVDSLGQVTFEVIAENKGIAARMASGSARLVDWHGQTVKEFTFYPDMVLSESIRKLRAQEKDPTNDTGITPSELMYDPVFLLGPYTLQVTLEGASIETQEVTILALPFSIALTIGLGLLLVLAWHYLKPKLLLGKDF